jgi:hypothetical protein
MNKRYQIVLNVAVPIALGLFIYFIAAINLISRQLSNFLPDGLWAYALASCLLIVWDRQANFIWMTILGCFFITFELLQWLHYIEGTGDIKDVLIYFFFGFLALTTNQFFNQNQFQ